MNDVDWKTLEVMQPEFSAFCCAVYAKDVVTLRYAILNIFTVVSSAQMSCIYFVTSVWSQSVSSYIAVSLHQIPTLHCFLQIRTMHPPIPATVVSPSSAAATEEGAPLRGHEGESEEHALRLQEYDDGVAPLREWDGGLCDCCYQDSVPLCAVTALLPCVTFGWIGARARLGNFLHLTAICFLLFSAVQLVTFVFQIFPFPSSVSTAEAVPAGPSPSPEEQPTTVHVISTPVFIVHNVVMWAAIVAFTFWLGWYREKVRQRLGIRGSAFEDFCVMFWCPQCSLCQQARTLEARGSAMQPSDTGDEEVGRGVGFVLFQPGVDSIGSILQRKWFSLSGWQ